MPTEGPSSQRRTKESLDRMNAAKKAKEGAAEKKRQGTVRAKVGKALEKTMLTETGRKVARKIGGNPEPKLMTYKKYKKKKGSKPGGSQAKHRTRGT